MSPIHRKKTRESDTPIWVVNKATETVPPYGVMAIQGDFLQRNGRGRWYAPIKKPDDETEFAQNWTMLLFNGKRPIRQGRTGQAVISAPVECQLGGDPLQGESVGPAKNSWLLWRGGLTNVVLGIKTFGTSKYGYVRPAAGLNGRVTYVNEIAAKTSTAISSGLADIYFHDDNDERVKSVSPVANQALRLRVANDHPDDAIEKDSLGYASLTAQGKWVNMTEFC